ncbi:MAG: MFS transporter [Spirochaetia bacterium]|nr:MFS transporter [Spirochaetia bacterium]
MSVASLKHWRYRIFASTWLCYAGYYFCRKPFYVVKASFGDANALTAADLGLIGSAYLISYSIGQFLAGWAGNRAGSRLTLLVGMAVSIGCNAAFGFANSLGAILGFMALNGLAQATGWSGNVAAMAPWFKREERGTVMGLWSTNFQAGGVLANTFAAFLLGHYGFKYSFLGGSLVLIAVWIFFYFNQRNRPQDVGLDPLESNDSETRQPETGQTSTLQASAEHTSSTNSKTSDSKWNREIWITILLVGSFYFFVKFIRYALWSWAPYFLQKNYHLAGDDAGYIATLFDFCGIIGVITAGFLSDRWFKGRRAQISVLFIAGMTAGCIGLYFLGGQAVWIFGAGIGFIGFMLYGPDALLTGAGAIDIGTQERAALAAGIINGMGSIGSVFQDLMIGDLYTRSGGKLEPVFLLLVGSAAMALLLMGIVLLRNRSQKSDV